MNPGKTLFDKVWDAHVVADPGDGTVLLHVDRHLLHDLSGKRGLDGLARLGRRLHSPGLTFATPDHSVSSAPGRTDATTPRSRRLVGGLREQCRRHQVRFFDLGQPGHGIVHVMGPELGITLPGVTLLCGDSHTCTHGALGALAFGIGSSEITHVLATQTVVQAKPKRMRVTFDGALAPGVGAKDLVLSLIGQVGAGGGGGHAVEYAGPTVRALPVEGRMTVCNLSIEFGAKIGMVAPDDAVFEYLAGRPLAPAGALWDRALAHWRGLPSDPQARFDAEVRIDARDLRPQVTWGTSPQHVAGVDEAVPDPDAEPDPNRRQAMRAALEYMGLAPGAPLAGLAIDWVFIGSCTNSRLSDLREAAAVACGRKVAAGVRAWVVPGSQGVKEAAQAEGLDRVFADAGFEWREPGCAMCVAANGETVPPGQRCVSTTNRNFVGRQGPGARTHLASPATAAASAVAGRVADVRRLLG